MLELRPRDGSACPSSKMMVKVVIVGMGSTASVAHGRDGGRQRRKLQVLSLVERGQVMSGRREAMALRAERRGWWGCDEGEE